MKRLPPILLIILLLPGCLESNPQPSPEGKEGNGVHTGGIDAPTLEDDTWAPPSQDTLEPSQDVVAGEDAAEPGDLAPDAPAPVDVSDAWDAGDIPDVPDIAEVDAAPHDETAITGGGSSFGMCWGACKSDLTLDGPAAHVVTSGWDDTIFTDNSGVLTAAGLEESIALAEALVGVNLQGVYGCPDCADGGASYISLIREEVTSSHAYEFGNPPQALEDADFFVFQVISDLLTCTPSALVIPNLDCVPAG